MHLTYYSSQRYRKFYSRFTVEAQKYYFSKVTMIVTETEVEPRDPNGLPFVSITI